MQIIPIEFKCAYAGEMASEMHATNGAAERDEGSITNGTCPGVNVDAKVCAERDCMEQQAMRILIVDDHSLFGEGLRLLLSGTLPVGDIVCCQNGDEALRLGAATEFELVLLDWNLGSGIGGEALLAALKTVLPTSRIVIVSGENGAAVVRQAIEAGAVGFVPKESSPTLLIDALTIIAHGGVYLPMAVLLQSRHHPDISQPRHLRRIADAFPGLTARHAEVLDRLARGMSNKQIARVLDISDGTVKQHLNAIFRELEVANRTEAVYLMAKNGVRFD